MNSALIVIDIQKDYFPGGKMELAGPVEASRQAGRLLAFFREKRLPVVHVRHLSARKDATFLAPGTQGVEFHENVAPLAGETIIDKHFPNAFRDTRFGEYLQSKQIEQLVICGMMSHMCIDATTRAAFDKGYSCLIAHDACATGSLAFGGVDVPAKHVHTAFMAALASVYAGVHAAEEIILMMGKGSGT